MSWQPSTTTNFLPKFTARVVIMLMAILLSVSNTSAQSCNCDHVIPNSQLAVDGITLNVQPGDTVCLQAGLRSYLYLNHFNGDSLNPVVIINYGGNVIVQNNNFNYGIKVAHSSYFRLTGTGNASSEYGIKILQTKAGANGLSMDDKSTNFEVDHFEISNTGFAGIMCKTDPKCDLSTNAGNFTQYDVLFHDNYIYNTGGEGMYIGHSSYSGYVTSCNGQPDTLYPHEIKGLRIYNNRVENAHLDGIQIGCANEDCEVYGNSVTNYGTDGNSAHTAGIQLGGGTTGKCYNNFISGGKGTGIMVFGTGNNIIFNNVIVNAGLNYFPTDPTKRVHGIFVDDRTTVPGRSFNIINNTIVNVKTDGIRFSSLLSTNNQIINNIIIHPGSIGAYSTSQQSYINTATGVNAVKHHNLTEPNMTNIQFRDTTNSNFRLKAESPARDMGADVSTYGVTFDFDNLIRPEYASYDIGAFEYHPVNLWTGQSSPSWNDEANWSQSDIPNLEDDVVITTDATYLPYVVTSGMVCHNLTITPGAELAIAQTAEITITGNLTIQAGGTLENSGTIYLEGNLTNENPN